MKHKSEYYKFSAVKYYIKNKDNIRKPVKFLIVKIYIIKVDT